LFFEKDKKNICVAFYADNEQTLSKIAYNFFNERKIPISQSNINLIVTKCNGDRQNLFNELEKIENYSKSEKKINTEILIKLTNLIENHGVSELIDNCLAKNKKKIIYILNENNFSNEDCVLITRTFLNKSKKILPLTKEYELNKNIDQVLSSAKPPIFWKDKEITKQQIYKWSPESLRALIYKLNELEFLVKKNINNSIYLITDFILDQVTTKT
jgi:DNA polymerase-3 subunit delta